MDIALRNMLGQAATWAYPGIVAYFEMQTGPGCEPCFSAILQYVKSTLLAK